jgi:hypothetical protein
MTCQDPWSARNDRWPKGRPLWPPGRGLYRGTGTPELFRVLSDEKWQTLREEGTQNHGTL